MKQEVTYRFFKNRREFVISCNNFVHALRIAANHHEDGDYPMEIVVNGKKYSSAQILLHCRKKGML